MSPLRLERHSPMSTRRRELASTPMSPCTMSSLVGWLPSLWTRNVPLTYPGNARGAERNRTLRLHADSEPLYRLSDVARDILTHCAIERAAMGGRQEASGATSADVTRGVGVNIRRAPSTPVGGRAGLETERGGVCVCRWGGGRVGATLDGRSATARGCTRCHRAWLGLLSCCVRAQEFLHHTLQTLSIVDSSGRKVHARYRLQVNCQ